MGKYEKEQRNNDKNDRKKKSSTNGKRQKDGTFNEPNRKKRKFNDKNSHQKDDRRKKDGNKGGKKSNGPRALDGSYRPKDQLPKLGRDKGQICPCYHGEKHGGYAAIGHAYRDCKWKTHPMNTKYRPVSSTTNNGDKNKGFTNKSFNSRNNQWNGSKNNQWNGSKNNPNQRKFHRNDGNSQKSTNDTNKKCYNCGKSGHIQRNCPTRTTNNKSNNQQMLITIPNDTHVNFQKSVPRQPQGDSRTN